MAIFIDNAMSTSYRRKQIELSSTEEIMDKQLKMAAASLAKGDNVGPLPNVRSRQPRKPRKPSKAFCCCFGPWARLPMLEYASNEPGVTPIWWFSCTFILTLALFVFDLLCLI